MKSGQEEFILNVYYRPKLKSNILKIGQLLEKGYIIHLRVPALILKDKNEKNDCTVHMPKNRIFRMNIKSEIEIKLLSLKF